MTDHDDLQRLQYVAQIRSYRAEIAKRVMIAVTAGVVIAVLLIELWLLSLVRTTQADRASQDAQTHHAAVSAAQTLAILKDCLTPGGKCYTRSQAQTSDVLTKVKVIFEYVELCGRDPALTHNLHGLDGCVISLIKEHGL